MTKLLLPKFETAQALGISVRTLDTRTKEGSIPHVRVGHRVLYPVAALEQWIAAGCPAAGDAPETREDSD